MSNSDNQTQSTHITTKGAIMHKSDNSVIRSTGRLPLPNSDNSGNRYEGLEGVLTDLGAQITHMGDTVLIGRKTNDPTQNWTKRTTDAESDIRDNREVTHNVAWTTQPGQSTPKAAQAVLSAKPPKRPTRRELLERDNEGNCPAMLKYREALKAHRLARRIAQTGQGGTKAMSADIPRNLDMNDNTADVRSERTKGAGSRILVKVSPNVHSDGKWTTRTNSDKSETPDKGDVFHYSVIGWQIGAIRTLADMPVGNVRNRDKVRNSDTVSVRWTPKARNSDIAPNPTDLVLIGRFARYGSKFVITGERLNSDNLGKRAQDGESDISSKALNLDGTNPRSAKAAKVAGRASGAKRTKAAKAKADAKASVLSELADLAAKVHNDEKVVFAPMTRAERDIHRNMG